MICRIWRGWTTPANAEIYESIVRNLVIPAIERRRIPGFRKIDLLRVDRQTDVEFTTLMWFDSLADVTNFMGADYTRSHVPPEAQTVLSSFDERAVHHDVLDQRDQAAATP